MIKRHGVSHITVGNKEKSYEKRRGVGRILGYAFSIVVFIFRGLKNVTENVTC